MSVSFFAALFFLCSADLFFAVRIHDLNLRFGQFLLLAAVFPYLLSFFRSFGHVRPGTGILTDVLQAWIPFLGVYAVAALTAQDVPHTLLKWVWALFNIGGAALVCLEKERGENLEKGFFLGILAIALMIWVQFTALYLLGDWVTVAPSAPGEFPSIHLGGIFLGYTQDAGTYNGILIHRPHAFFYEPSYAGCALTFAFPLCLAFGLSSAGGFWRRVFVPALVFTAAWMTSSRSAMLGTTLSLLVLLAAGAWKKRKSLLKTVSQVMLVSVILVGLLAFSPGTRAYIGFVLGPLGPRAVISRVQDSGTSEGWRLENVLNSLKLWRQHPLLGMGAIPSPSGGRVLQGMGQSSESMWLEVGVEAGMLGFLSFCFAITRTLQVSFSRCQNADMVVAAAAALAAHFIVSMNFTSTFPRLDYWLIFFFCIRLLTRK